MTDWVRPNTGCLFYHQCCPAPVTGKDSKVTATCSRCLQYYDGKHQQNPREGTEIGQPGGEVGNAFESSRWISSHIPEGQSQDVVAEYETQHHHWICRCYHHYSHCDQHQHEQKLSARGCKESFLNNEFNDSNDSLVIWFPLETSWKTLFVCYDSRNEIDAPPQKTTAAIHQEIHYTLLTPITENQEMKCWAINEVILSWSLFTVISITKRRFLWKKRLKNVKSGDKNLVCLF